METYKTMIRCKNAANIRSLMLYSAQQANILPVTSVCNVRCIFCSNRQNPAGVETYTTGPQKLNDIEECLEFMEDKRPVIIGESVTRICEGEPFTHPRIKEILSLVRRRLPGSPIQITSNGSLLDREMVSFLSALGNVIVYLSLNSSDYRVREAMMGDKSARRAINCVTLLREAGVEFHGSIVAMPHIYGYGDLEETIGYLAREGARTVRVFIPGYTRKAPEVLRFPGDLPARVQKLVSGWQQKTTVPVTCEPPGLTDLRPAVAGVIAGSPAGKAGIAPGDVIKMIDGQRPYSRVDAFHRLKERENPAVVVDKGEGVFEYTLVKSRGQSPGVVMEYDLGPEWEDLERVVRRNRAEKVLIVTSTLAREVVIRGMHIFGRHIEWRVVSAPNLFFGGSIGAAGLLVVEDMIAAVNGFWQKHPHWRPDLILLPPVAFDYRGRDLTGRSYREVGERTGVPGEII